LYYKGFLFSLLCILPSLIPTPSHAPAEKGITQHTIAHRGA